MIISILGIVAEMELSQIKERQKEGIELAKLRGVYKGRVHGSKEDIRTFLSKPKIAKTIEYLKKTPIQSQTVTQPPTQPGKRQ